MYGGFPPFSPRRSVLKIETPNPCFLEHNKKHGADLQNYCSVCIHDSSSMQRTHVSDSLLTEPPGFVHRILPPRLQLSAGGI